MHFVLAAPRPWHGSEWRQHGWNGSERRQSEVCELDWQRWAPAARLSPLLPPCLLIHATFVSSLLGRHRPLRPNGSCRLSR
jgi:hypothetical protein